MELSIQVNEIKLQLKKWELNFTKKNGSAPTKSHIDQDASVKALYVEYYRLKKKEKEAADAKPQTAVLHSKQTNSVWGKELLKCNSKQLPAVNVDQESNELPTAPLSPKTPSYRENLRKHISSSKLSSTPLSLKKSRTNIPRTPAKENFCKTPNLKVENKFNFSPANFDNCSPNIQVKQTPSCTILPSPKVSSKSKQLKTKCINVKWLENQEEDLTDLLKLETVELTIKTQNENDLLEAKDTKNVANTAQNSSDSHNVSLVNKEATSGLQQEHSRICPNEVNSPSNQASCQSTISIADNSSPNLSASDLPESSIPKQLKCNTKVSAIPSSTPVIIRKDQSRNNTNFVRLNMKQKVFSKKGRGRFLRKQVYREKCAKKGFSGKSGWKGRSGGKSTGKSEFRSKSEDKCFKCGENGHWSSECKKGKAQRVVEEKDEVPSETLAALVGSSVPVVMDGNNFESFSAPVVLTTAKPIFTPETYNGKEVLTVLKKFGFSQFRDGQEEAIKRILCGFPTLLVLSTGSGKSLCYQLPAHMYSASQGSITLVVSPLVSLMDDQVHGLPKFLKATRLHSGMSKDQREKTMAEIQAHKVDILLVSPEALMNWAGMSPLYSPLSKLPPVSFVCIDECHCLAEWSHSFRPSYLRVCEILQKQLGVKCLVGLTATATISASRSVAQQLGITDPEQGMIVKMDLPDNLYLTVSKDRYKDESLEQLLKGGRFSALDSIIIYCTRRNEVARVSSYLRTRLESVPRPQAVEETNADKEEEATTTSKKKRKRPASNKGSKRKAAVSEAECYHAGMSASERKKVQNSFMSGRLRIVVATVAFGMGIDKHDVRAVIHYNMPRSFERYVQEVGRAGRDGLPAHCHLFLDPEGGDLFELGRHSYGKTVDRFTVKRLVEAIFKPCSCDKLGIECKGHFASMDIEKTVTKLDVAKEGIETLMCYLELEGLLHVYLPTEIRCSLSCYGGPRQMVECTKKCQAVAVALSKQDKIEKNCTDLDFSLVEVTNALQCDIGSVKRTLRQLMWDTTLAVDGRTSGKSGVVVQFSDVSFLMKTTVKSSDEFVDSLTSSLYGRVMQQEKKELGQLKTAFDTMQKYSYPNVGYCMDDFDDSRSVGLKKVINAYFKEENQVVDLPVVQLSPDVESDVRGAIRQFLFVHSGDLEGTVTGRAIARIFHGIESPRFPAKTWGPARRFWRSKVNVNFNALLKIATSEILQFR